MDFIFQNHGDGFSHPMYPRLEYKLEKLWDGTTVCFLCPTLQTEFNCGAGLSPRGENIL